MMNAPIWLLAIAGGGALFSGALLRLWVSSQRFARLNPLGIETFDSLGSMASTRFTETLAGWVSNLLLGIGLLFGLLIAARYLLPWA